MLSLSRLYRLLTRVTEKVHDPKRPRALALSRRAFTRAVALVAFGGVARPASPRVLPSDVCECNADGQCTGGCRPRNGICPGNLPWGGQPAGANCWCEPNRGGTRMEHVCDCYCPDATWKYCVCRTIGYRGCGGGIIGLGDPIGPM